ncbi:2-hydroxyacid dehydrogenase [Roseivivax sediminis]|uniref:Glyoxylate/hydroxypyruvate reductase A n=1 Tax=Roseivivax sediminis TaxID=936889 RepID=A0A1I1TAK2_9RHOB|nr:glyoxylate/hydroxypyruvate reductase A [Roseivivax sediminis]SFD55664.1 glyoxylate/hydroxypyruvate reductase A [Roseivivax sediminis]
MTTLLLSTPERAEVWGRVFAEAGERLLVDAADVRDPGEVLHLACWTPPADIARYTALKTVISVGAGVDQMPPLPEGVTLVRTLAPGIEQMVRDYVVMAALALYRDLPVYIAQSAQGKWAPMPAPDAARRRVGIMGMGRIGRLAARSLTGLGFAVAGWSRSGAPVEDVEMFAQDDLVSFLGRTDILICLLPLTGATHGVLNAELLSHLPAGAALVQAGRGAQLDMAALRAALDSGHMKAAMLDVTDPEPLPADHWAWRHPKVLVTPHVAAQTDAEEGAAHALSVVSAARAGHAIPGRVDPQRGY